MSEGSLFPQNTRAFFPSGHSLVFNVNNPKRRAVLAIKPQGSLYTFLSYRRNEVDLQYFSNNGSISEADSPGAEPLHLPKDTYPDILLIKIWSDGKRETPITLLNDRKNWLKFEFFVERFVFDKDVLPTNLRVRQPPMKKPGVIAQHIGISCGRFNEFPTLKRVCQRWGRQTVRCFSPNQFPIPMVQLVLLASSHERPRASTALRYIPVGLAYTLKSRGP
ncbi:hypothetical protein BT69DRAFT_1282866 [Atractiella rhizophila]|nr:hypothetical protein BT69DRAFT_1282866 [Atractiella rhizophila]